MTCLQVSQRVDARCHSRSERDKFHTYIDDLEKIVRLLLNLSGQLARAENACQALAPTADPKLKVSPLLCLENQTGKYIFIINGVKFFTQNRPMFFDTIRPFYTQLGNICNFRNNKRQIDFGINREIYFKTIWQIFLFFPLIMSCVTKYSFALNIWAKFTRPRGAEVMHLVPRSF